MSVDVLLVRHAIAWERDHSRWPDDRERPLTREGRKKFEKAAEGLQSWMPRVDRLITSPLTRAVETAQILTNVAAWPPAEESEALAPEATPDAVLAVIRARRVSSVALVGHEPALSVLARTLLVGTRDVPSLAFRKGGVCHVRFDSAVRAGAGNLIAFVPPRILRAMR
jgi:phosphohistidine phosphatase